MPWIAPGVHVIFADPRQEAEYLRRRLAGEPIDVTVDAVLIITELELVPAVADIRT